MSYTKQTWQSGDVITAAKLNHIEDGIAASGGGGGGAMLVHVTSTGGQRTADKTLSEILTAMANDTPVFATFQSTYCLLSSNGYDNGVAGMALHYFQNGTAYYYCISCHDNDGVDDWTTDEITLSFSYPD